MVKKIEGISVNYIDEGEGEIVLLLHGWGANITLYRSVIDTLKQGRRVIALDMPGFGKTPEPPEPWCVDDYVDFVLKFIASFSIEKLSVVVHSFGGRVFFKMNARESLPFTVERAVLIDSAGILPKKSLRQRRRSRLKRSSRKATFTARNRIIMFLPTC